MIESPILQRTQLEQIRRQTQVKTATIAALYAPNFENAEKNELALEQALQSVCEQVEQAARSNTGIIILSDANISQAQAAIPALLTIAAANQHLVKHGLRFNSSLIMETGQAASPHDVATILGFGASAICPLSVHNRVITEYTDTAAQQKALYSFQKGVEKSLMKTMGKFGLCTAESYIGGEFFESNYLDTDEPKLKPYFPNINASVGGVRYTDIAASATEWHHKALSVKSENDIPFLGLFKERNEGAGHTFGNTAVREYINMTDEAIMYIPYIPTSAAGESAATSPKPLPSQQAAEASDTAYLDFGYEKRTPAQIDAFGITPAYRSFTHNLTQERANRPAALRDVMDFPADISNANTKADFDSLLGSQDLHGNNNFLIRGLRIEKTNDAVFDIRFTENSSKARLDQLAEHLQARFAGIDFGLTINSESLRLRVSDSDSLIYNYLNNVRPARSPITLDKVQPAHEITPTFASGAMSHGALLAEAHEAVAQGTNIAGGMSNSGEGGEHSSRFGTIRSSKIKQFASGRFGVWAGYLADPNLEEIEIKIGQGAKPGEGGQLPAPKVSVEIAALRGGTPKVELVSPPPHHDTYSIEDLGQLIHDAKAARVRVVVKLVSSEGIGTIAVGVAKAGADVINVAGNTGGTGAAAVTSLKNTGRSPEIGIAEVHQALAENGLRDKVILRCSAAHQNGADVVKSAILGGDSFEFGTTSLMMLRCVMAKNCNIRCPAGLTTAHEEFKGDPRVLAQFFMNLAHEVREILADLGYTSLQEIRGKTELLHLMDHPSMVGQIHLQKLLAEVTVIKIEKPIYLEKDFAIDDLIFARVKSALFESGKKQVIVEGDEFKLNNRNKTVGGQTAVDLERMLAYELSADQVAASNIIYTNQHGRRYLADDTVIVRTHGSAGQSYAAFNNDGMRMEHTGTCNDGVGKTACGGTIVIKSPGGGSNLPGENVLIGNFALFGASGGKTFINGEAGDRFAVRNSGAMAVVEGVGDFACEYMINGAVLNLGGFGKGFCTGMSGGNAYQYDPDNRLQDLYDDTSVSIHNLTDDTDAASSHEQFVLYMLEQHIEHTGSDKAKAILANWAYERQHFKFALPLWLNRTQTAEYLSKAMDRKAMIEELSVAFAQKQIEQIKQAYKSNLPLFQGAIPGYGETDTDLTLKLINSYAVIDKAQQIARDQLVKAGQPLSDTLVDKHAYNLVMERPRKLQDALIKNIREAYSQYDDAQLAALMAEKRLNDYKMTLMLRDVQSIYSIGSTAWIIEQDRFNRVALAGLPSIDKNLASLESLSIVKDMLESESA
jgi:glutamate synthase (NADPH/NADH) large chain